MSKRQAKKPFLGNSILKNLAMIFITGGLLVILTLVFLHLYTRHGQNIVVPKLEGLQINEANTILNAKGLNIEVVDSIYSRDAVPGAILDQTPKSNNKVKEGRSIYVTVYSRNPQQVVVPELVDYSTRQALALLNSLGFTQISLEEVPSEYSGLVLAVEYHGRTLAPDEKIPAGSPLNLIVSNSQLTDSIEVDSEIIITPERLESDNRSQSNESSQFDDSFF